MKAGEEKERESEVTQHQGREDRVGEVYEEEEEERLIDGG